jgi:hypothetical protein
MVVEQWDSKVNCYRRQRFSKIPASTAFYSQQKDRRRKIITADHQIPPTAADQPKRHLTPWYNYIEMLLIGDVAYW